MNYLNDYQEILNDTFINHRLFRDLKSSNIPDYINKLTNELRKLSTEDNMKVITQALRLMTEANIFRLALEMKVSVNMLPDPKVPERKYVQVRGAVPIKKGKRVWVGQYMGKEEDVTDKNGELLQEVFNDGREKVVFKVIKSLYIENSLEG